MATYPSNVVVFSTHVNLTEIIDAAHPNNIQSEIVAIENTLGANPHISTTPSSAGTFTGTSTVYSTLTARLANIETGVVSDAHPHYLHKAGGDTVQSSGIGVVGLTFQAITGQTADFLTLKDVGGTPLARWDVAGNITAVAGTFSGAVTSAGVAVVTTTGTQTLTNKTLNGATLDGTSTLGGVSGTTAARSVRAPQSSDVATGEASSSTGYIDLATSGPAVTVTLDAGQSALVIASANIQGPSGSSAYISFAVSGAETIAASDANGARFALSGVVESTVERASIFTATAGGSYTFTAKYRTDNASATATWFRRRLIAKPL